MFCRLASMGNPSDFPTYLLCNCHPFLALRRLNVVDFAGTPRKLADSRKSSSSRFKIAGRFQITQRYQSAGLSESVGFNGISGA
jgi:hypothetical protein